MLPVVCDFVVVCEGARTTIWIIWLQIATGPGKSEREEQVFRSEKLRQNRQYSTFKWKMNF